MKRFTETTKWNDPWFRRLSERAKLLWWYITDNCDAAGLIDLDFECASFHIGGKVEEKHLTELGDRVQRTECGKVFIPKFIPFQYGTLSSGCPAHNPVFKLVRAYQLTSTNKGYQYPSHRVLDKDKDKEKDQEGVQGEDKNGTQPSNGTIKIPTTLGSSPVFVEAWKRWLEHLKQKKKPPTHHAQELQLKKLSNMGVGRAVETLNHCIEKNWQGIYEPVDHALKKPPQNQI